MAPPGVQKHFKKKIFQWYNPLSKFPILKIIFLDFHYRLKYMSHINILYICICIHICTSLHKCDCELLWCANWWYFPAIMYPITWTHYRLHSCNGNQMQLSRDIYETTDWQNMMVQLPQTHIHGKYHNYISMYDSKTRPWSSGICEILRREPVDLYNYRFFYRHSTGIWWKFVFALIPSPSEWPL